MIISPPYFDKFLGELTRERFANGNEFVCYEINQPVYNKYDLHFTASDIEALEYCYEMSTEKDRYSFFSLRSVIKAMQDFSSTTAFSNATSSMIDIAAITNLRIQKILQNDDSFDSQKPTIMIEKNYAFIKNQLKGTGFGESHDENLKTQMKLLPPDFILTHQTKFGKDEVVATLHFRKSTDTDMYFFNKYNMLLKKDGEDAVLKQMFYLRGKEDNITFKEAFNLMQERSVLKERMTKEGQTYTTWLKLDFKESDKEGNYKLKSQNYGYDINKALAKYPIIELNDPDMLKQMVSSLERGNLQEVSMNIGGQDSKVYIAASPASGLTHALKVFDTKMQRIQGLSQENTKEQQQQQNHQKKIKAGDESDKPVNMKRKSRGIS